MSIDINGISSPKIQAPTDDSQLKKSTEQAVAPPETSAKSSTADTVSLSDNAVQLGKLDNTAITAPVIDTQRVEQVKQAIADGSYEVDPAKVADKLMQFESMLKPKG
jgi:negative regulator of flagellin synthesis FlgM